MGVFDVKDENDAYWAEGLDSQYTDVVFTDYDTMLGDCVDTGVVNITKAVHNYAVDYASMNMTDLASTNTSAISYTVSIASSVLFMAFSVATHS